MGPVGGQAVFDNDEGQLGVIAAQLFQEPLGGVSLTVVFRRPILVGNRLRSQWQHRLEGRMDEDGAYQLMVIAGLALAGFDPAVGTADLTRGKLPRAIERHQILPVSILIRFERFVALEVAVHGPKSWPQLRRVDRIQARA